MLREPNRRGVPMTGPPLSSAGTSIQEAHASKARSMWPDVCKAVLPACLRIDCRSSSNTKIYQVDMQGVIDLEDRGATLHVASSRQLGDNDYILDCGCRHDRFLASISLFAFCDCAATAQSICLAHAGKCPTWRPEPSA